MKTATIRDLRNEFARLSKWLDKGEKLSGLHEWHGENTPRF